MPDPTAALPSLPFPQPNVLAMSPLMRQLQADQPITRVRTPAGDEAWLITRYADVKSLLGDPRLGRSHPDPEHAPRISDSILFGGPMEPYETEHADHAQMRALLTPFFSARRMETLRPRVEAFADQLIGTIAARTPPVDLHATLSFPLPVLVICELLGVPSDDREQLHAWSTDLADLHDQVRARTALGRLVGYMGELVQHKRAQPADDVLSGLCVAAGSQLSNEHIAFLGAMLLFAGHETTVVRIDLGTLLLLTHPPAHRALLDNPDLIGTAIEEILRAPGTADGGLPRYARSDIEIDGMTIRAGDAVLLSIGAANHDAAAFANPDAFDAARSPNPHLTFGHGPRFCIGAPLARIELQTVFTRLIPRFPTMRLVRPVDELRARDLLTGGLGELRVTW
jgi:pentalenolactone synthase